MNRILWTADSSLLFLVLSLRLLICIGHPTWSAKVTLTLQVKQIKLIQSVSPGPNRKEMTHDSGVIEEGGIKELFIQRWAGLRETNKEENNSKKPVWGAY